MASPIGNLIHRDPLPPPLPPAPVTASSSLAPVITNPPNSAHSVVSPPIPSPLAVPSPSLASSSAPVSAVTGPASNPLPPRSHNATQSLYQCADCLRRYSRPEHLQRHIATHTLGKRFTCDVCSKAFSRADLLKRHRANHQDDNGSKRRRINSSPGAGRVAHACVACAKARVKCEEMKPCTRCKNRGLNCEFASSEDAAMHLLHLSANARVANSQRSNSPESSYYPAQSVTSQLQQPTPTLQPGGYSDPMQNTVMNPSHILVGNPALNEEAQLPTPETMIEQSNADHFQQPYQGHVMGNMVEGNMLDMAKVPFSDFLREVMYEQSLTDNARMMEVQGLDVLDFCDDADLELNDIDFGLLDHWNLDGMQPRGPNMPELQSGIDDPVDITTMRSRLVKVWTESPWRWNPGNADSGFGEQTNLPLTSRDLTGSQDGNKRLDRVISETLHPSGRDKILAVVLSTCRNDNTMSRVASSFPPAELMDSWIHIFLASNLCQVSSWIHYGSFSLNTQWPEWLAIAAAAGAVLANVPTLRRFGFALQEAVRLTIPTRFEENNRKIADVGLVQALMLVQDVGLWSGNRRKMEIAEAHLSVPIAMMRYRGKFQRSSYPNIVIDPADEGDVLEEKWKKWYHLESWKRLVFHVFCRDAQVSMTQFCNPTVSYAELTLPLPCSKELWFARTKDEFKMRYLESGAGEGKRPPSLGDLLRDVNMLSANHRRLDVQYAISIFLHGFWGLIWEYRQLSSIYRSTAYAPALSGNPNLLLDSRHQELCKLLQSFQLVTQDWHEMLSAQEGLVLNLLLMNLHVSLDDLQLFAGKEGEEQARRIYPILQGWSESSAARRAVWHAGQILRQAKLFPPGHLKDFYAIAVVHGALCLWTFGVVQKATRRGVQPIATAFDLVYLDGDDSPYVQNYISFGQGRAVIRGPKTRDNSVPPAESTLEDPRSCVEVAQDTLRANFIDSQDALPPIMENLIHMLKQLGNAAWAVGLG